MISIIKKNLVTIIFVAVLIIMACVLAGVYKTCDKRIELYEYVDPNTGVHYYIYNDVMYPRVCKDGTYYTGGMSCEESSKNLEKNMKTYYIPITNGVSSQ